MPAAWTVLCQTVKSLQVDSISEAVCFCPICLH